MKPCAQMFAAACVLAISPGSLRADPPIRETLDSKSLYTAHLCVGPCDCAPQDLIGPMTGVFQLVHTSTDPLYAHYDVANAHWTAVVKGGKVDLRGSGQYRIGGEVARMHQLTLELSIDGQAPVKFDSGLVAAGGRAFPHIDIVVQTKTGTCTEWRLDLFTSQVCPADIDGNGFVNGDDYDAFMAAFVAGSSDADFDANGFVNGDDFDFFAAAFESGC